MKSATILLPYRLIGSEDNAYIASLDPLEADAILSKLPEMNTVGDVSGIISAIQTIIPGTEQIQYFSYEESLAAVRDLGILAGSLKKHGVEPIHAVNQLEPLFLKFAQKTDMIPRDTLIHYTIWNPDGARQRRYTIYADEIQMIHSAKIAIPRLNSALNQLVLLHKIPLNSHEFVEECRECAENLNGMVEAIVHVMKKVSRKIFAEELRAYYDPIQVQGQDYLGPGAVEMPLFIFDHLLWSAEFSEATYLQFKQGLLPYSHPHFRQMYATFQNQPSLLTKVCQQLKTAPKSQDILDGANSVMKLFKILLTFRKPHMKIAEQAYVHTEHHVREQGSGGYRSDTLSYIIDLTTQAMNQLAESINSSHNFSANAT